MFSPHSFIYLLYYLLLHSFRGQRTLVFFASYIWLFYRVNRYSQLVYKRHQWIRVEV